MNGKIDYREVVNNNLVNSLYNFLDISIILIEFSTFSHVCVYKAMKTNDNSEKVKKKIKAYKYSCGHVRVYIAFNPFATAHANCDMDTDDGGWTVVQRNRAESEVSFDRNWTEYEEHYW